MTFEPSPAGNVTSHGSSLVDLPLAAILETSPDGVVVLDREGRYLYANAEGERYVGDRDGILGRSVLQVLPGAAGSSFETAFRRVVETGKRESFDRYRGTDTRHYLLDLVPVGDLVVVHFRRVDALVEAERRLEETVERLDLALAASSQGIFEIDVRSRQGVSSVRQWSIAGERPALASLTFEAWADRIHPEDRPAAIESAERILSGSTRIYRDEYRFRVAGEDAHRWIQSTGSVVAFDPDGSPRRLIGTWRDVHDRRETEGALRRSETQRRRLFERMSQGVMHRGEDGRIVEANPAAQRMLGCTLEELQAMAPGVECWDAILPDGTRLESEEYPSRIARRTGRDVPPRVLGVRNRTTGERRWLLVAAGPMEDDEFGEGVYLTFTDVHALQEAEAALRESEERYRAIVENTPDVISRIGPDLRTLFASPGLRRYLDLGPADVVGLRPGEIEGIPPDVAARLERTIRAVFETGVARTETLRFQGPDGTLSLEWRLFPELDATGAVRTVVSIVKDETDRVGLEEQVREAQKMEAVGQLAGGIAHDFNNLLTVIRGHASLALEEADGSIRMDLEEIERSADRAAALTRQLLAFSRKQSGEARVVDLGEIVEGMEQMIRRLIGEHIEVVTEIDPDRGPIRADPGQIEQVVMNLVVNARDAMPQGGRIRLRVGRRERGRGLEVVDRTAPPRVCLEVTDTGTGMDEATLAKIFEPFFTTKAAGKGTGLGLSTVYGIVKQCRGTIEVESEPGRGSRFRICLPISEEDADPEPPSGDEEAPHPAGPATILLVEDEAPVRQLARRILEEAGHRVLEAEGPAEALRLVRSGNAPDLVVTDVVMPEMTGPEVVRRLLGIRPGFRALYMTGYAEGVLPDRGAEMDGEVVLDKPFTPRGLLAKVAEALAGPPAAPGR